MCLTWRKSLLWGLCGYISSWHFGLTLLCLLPWLPASVSKFCVCLGQRYCGVLRGIKELIPSGWVFSVCKSSFSFSDVHVTIWSLDLWWCVGRSKHWKERRSKFFFQNYCIFTALKWLWNSQMRLPLWQFLLVLLVSILWW